MSDTSLYLMCLVLKNLCKLTVWIVYIKWVDPGNSIMSADRDNMLLKNTGTI